MASYSLLHTRVVSGTGGGPEKTILNSPRFLIPYGYDCLCAYMYPPGDSGFQTIQQRAAQAGSPLWGIEDRGMTDWSVVRKLAALCRERKVDIWHGHDYKSNAIGLLLRRFHRMKLVTTVHGWVFQTARTPFYYAVDRFCIKRYDKVICVSTDLYDKCLEFGVAKSKLVLIENAIDTEEFTPYGRDGFPDGDADEGSAPANPGLANPAATNPAATNPAAANPAPANPGQGGAAFRIGAVGRLAPEKGFAPLIQTVVELKRLYPQIQLTIFGDGPQRGELERLVRELGADSFVRLPGFASDLKKIYSEMDLFVLNSVREGLPNVCLEAMATGTPMISTAVAGVPRLAEDGKDALLIPLNDPTALKAALVRLIESPELRVRLAIEARKTVVEKFSFAHRMEKMRAVYESLF